MEIPSISQYCQLYRVFPGAGNPGFSHREKPGAGFMCQPCHTEIAPILTIIFQRSLDTGIVSKDWKHAIITPAFKKGS